MKTPNVAWVALGLLGGVAASAGTQTAAENPPLKVAIVSGSFEYESDTSLTAFMKYFEDGYNAKCTFVSANGKWDDLPGLEALDDCDVALFFTRRLRIEGEQLDRVKRYCLSGRPIVALRTASHGFQNWLDMDKLVLGGNYHDHYGNGPTYRAEVVPAVKDHPVLDGVTMTCSRHSLYKTSPVAADATILMNGFLPDGARRGDGANEPVTWVREYKGGRVFYSALGGQKDFENSTFRRLLANALFWAAKRPVERHELVAPPRRTKPQGALNLRVRTRTEKTPGSGQWEEAFADRQLSIAETAILICDMWDSHWCTGAAERCAALAEKMNPILHAARDKGVQIIHCPSETMSFYADLPQRRRMQLAPAAPTPAPRAIAEPPLPIDDSDGGCDTDDTPQYQAWTCQHPAIDIAEFDGISDSGQEVWNFMQQEGIKNLLVMGVHTNMCVLGRSFAIRQMTKWGVACVLIRDLTDAMYDPKDPPHVTHDEGTELVVQHIEKYWCPSATSEDLVKGLP